MTTACVVAATAADLSAIRALYNYEIREGVALWWARERTEAEMAAWISGRVDAGFPVLAARDDDGALLGFGSFGPFRSNDGYAATIEHSLYVDPAARGRGVGGQLLDGLEAAAREWGAHVMIGGIEAANTASIALHARRGFVESARMPEVGRKFDRWLTLVLMQKILNSRSGLTGLYQPT